MTVTAAASPSLALIKYWGKAPGGPNLAATSSLAVSLGAFTTTTVIRESHAGSSDAVIIDGQEQPLDRFLPMINAFRADSAHDRPAMIESSNDFPTAAGLASSSSGLAALALGLDAFYKTQKTAEELSAIARMGSGSAARAVFGGFTIWQAGSASAQQIAPPDHWPELRILIAILKSGPKDVPSRDGMERSRLTSPYYGSWVAGSEALFNDARSALDRRALDDLGPLMRQSYLRMFSTMFTAEPPFIYWLPESLAVIRLCERLRKGGIGVWETMDAGPQVKLLVRAQDAGTVSAAVEEGIAGASVVASEVGGNPTVETRGGAP